MGKWKEEADRIQMKKGAPEIRERLKKERAERVLNKIATLIATTIEKNQAKAEAKEGDKKEEVKVDQTDKKKKMNKVHPGLGSSLSLENDLNRSDKSSSTNKVDKEEKMEKLEKDDSECKDLIDINERRYIVVYLFFKTKGK